MPKGELIVIAHSEAKVRTNRNGAPMADGAEMGPLAGLFAPDNVNMIPLFGRPEERLRREAPPMAAMDAVHDTRAPDLSLFYRVDAPPERLNDLADQVRQNEGFEAAYIKPFCERPQFNAQLPNNDEAPAATPDFTKFQGYLEPASQGGVDARYAWTFDGGNGEGIGIIDIEGAWRFSHEVLSHLGGLAGGLQETDVAWRNHGTAVLGVMGGAGKKKGFGVTGICHGATIRSISHGGQGQTTATAIRQAADLLSPGDIILLEAHRPGPQSPTPFEANPLQQGYIAIEWWPDDYAAIVYAVRKGIIVVGAAGNGAVSLDDATYDHNPTAAGGFGPFPSWWRNPFRRVELDSGAILVGAGAPPAGFPPAKDFGPERSRLAFSNFGLPVDTQGWGHGVVSTGYGDLQGPNFYEDLWYTRDFNGTSSASPIVVGALACLQGAIKKAGQPPLTSTDARTLLRTTGLPQVQRPGQADPERIGNRPDLKQLLTSKGIGTAPIQVSQAGPDPKDNALENSNKVNGNQTDVVTQKVGLDNRPDPSVDGQHAGAAKSLAQRLDDLEVRLEQLIKFIGVQV